MSLGVFSRLLLVLGLSTLRGVTCTTTGVATVLTAYGDATCQTASDLSFAFSINACQWSGTCLYWTRDLYASGHIGLKIASNSDTQSRSLNIYTDSACSANMQDGWWHFSAEAYQVFRAGGCAQSAFHDTSGNFVGNTWWRWNGACVEPEAPEACPACAVDHLKASAKDGCKEESKEIVKDIVKEKMGPAASALSDYVADALDEQALQSDAKNTARDVVVQSCEACVKVILDALREIGNDVCTKTTLCTSVAATAKTFSLIPESDDGKCDEKIPKLTALGAPAPPPAASVANPTPAPPSQDSASAEGTPSDSMQSGGTNPAPAPSSKSTEGNMPDSVQGGGSTQGSLVIMTLTVQGVNYNDLVDKEQVLQSFKSNVKEAVASEAGDGIRAEHVGVELSPGSVKVKTTITPPEGIVVSGVQEKLSSSTTIVGSVVDKVKQDADLLQMASGDITATMTDAPVTVGTHSSTTSPDQAMEDHGVGGAAPVLACPFLVIALSIVSSWSTCVA
eukprot:TRINITY_DN35297_c0_g1_i1.p1 TRINITY_DN35297_c0_g1~~TRINITY_DN35297_c0_g1_i1.p1  ORF type:complete len:507 (-),score=81.73 TRINITY_DN35297_c0_g1_i1:479-1999(-)